MSSPHFVFTRDQARTMLLAAQGFHRDNPVEVGTAEVLESIRRMGVLQIDTIHVVARSPYLVLWSRLGTYDPKLLEQLLTDGLLFEYWSHEACFIPTEAFPIYRRFMLEASKHKWRFEWLNQNRESAEAMLAHVKENGPTRSADFKREDGRKGNWWDWKQEKIALDFLHTSGDLMISKREKFQRIYDLRERIMPDWKDELAPAYKDAVRSLVESTIEVLGVPTATWCADYYRLPKKEISAHLERLAEDDKILSATIEGLDGPAFVSAKNRELAQSVLEGGVALENSTLLSPFDPVVWDRKRALELFDFGYRIECYVPEPKRKFGYFVLPVLVGNRIVGRLDAKAHRKEKLFEVKSLFLESGVEDSDELVAQVAGAIKRCAVWHCTPKVKVVKSDRPKLAQRIQKAARAMP